MTSRQLKPPASLESSKWPEKTCLENVCPSSHSDAIDSGEKARGLKSSRSRSKLKDRAAPFRARGEAGRRGRRATRRARSVSTASRAPPQSRGPEPAENADQLREREDARQPPQASHSHQRPKTQNQTVNQAVLANQRGAHAAYHLPRGHVRFAAQWAMTHAPGGVVGLGIRHQRPRAVLPEQLPHRGARPGQNHQGQRKVAERTPPSSEGEDLLLLRFVGG